MNRRSLKLTCWLAGAAVVLAANLAFAGTPLPPAFGGGFVPPDGNTRRGEEKVYRNLSKYMRKLTTCYQRAARSLFNGVADELQSCLDAARSRYDKSADLFARRGFVPACLDQTAAGDTIPPFMQTTNVSAYCDPTSGFEFPPHFGGGFVPATENGARVSYNVHKNLSRMSRNLARCYQRAAKALFLGNPDNLVTCLVTRMVNYDRKAATIQQRGTVPPCLDQAALGTESSDFARDLNPVVYCASPSGAFIDGEVGL